MQKKRSNATRTCVRIDAAIERASEYCTILHVMSPKVPEIQMFCRYRYITQYGMAKKVIMRSAIAIFATRRFVVVLKSGVLKMTYTITRLPSREITKMMT